MFNYITMRTAKSEDNILTLFFAKNEREFNISVREIVEELDEPTTKEE